MYAYLDVKTTALAPFWFGAFLTLFLSYHLRRQCFPEVFKKAHGQLHGAAGNAPENPSKPHRSGLSVIVDNLVDEGNK